MNRKKDVFEMMKHLINEVVRQSENVKISDNLSDLGFEELDLYELLIRAETEYLTEIPAEDFDNAKTVDDWCNIILRLSHEHA